MRALVGEPSRRLPEADFALGGHDFRGDTGSARLIGDVPFNAFNRAIASARINLNLTRRAHAGLFASSTARPFELAMAGAAIVSNPYEGVERWFEPGHELLVARDEDEATSLYTELLSDRAAAEELGRRARERALDEHTYAHRARRILDLLGLASQAAVRVDGDGQHDPAELSAILRPVLAGEADIAVGSRFAGGAGYRPSRSRRVGIRILAWAVSRLVRQRVTHTTSGFQALNRRGIQLFAADYPHDYPEVEATVMVHRHRLRLREVPVRMRERAGGRSSITAFRSVYYMAKVLLALFVGIFRRNVVPLEDR